MSDLFTNFQQILRDVKNKYDINMSHPNGSIIYEKPYPAINKSVWMEINHTKTPSTTSFNFQFDIPLENGHRVSVLKNNRIPGPVQSVIHVPTKYMVRQPNGTNTTSYVHRSMRGGVDLDYINVPKHLEEYTENIKPYHELKNNDMFHDYVKSVSRLPRFGTAQQHVRDKNPTFESQRAMTDDELNEHFQNTHGNLRQEEYPHNIHLYVNDVNSDRILQYDYDIKTEKLTTDEEWD